VKPSVNRWSLITSSGVASNGIWTRIAVAAALTAALGLAACGRKGPLDPPPSASLPETPANYTARPGLGEQSYGAPASFLAPPSPADAALPAAPARPAAPAPAAPPPQQKTFFLDFLLGK
jgi:predicted small lipoprotein YifL